MQALVGIIAVLPVVALFWWLPFAGWKPQFGLPRSGRLRWVINLFLVLVFLILLCAELGISPSPVVEAAISILAILATGWMQSSRRRQLRRAASPSHRARIPGSSE